MNELTEALATVRARSLVRRLAKVDPNYADDSVFVAALSKHLTRDVVIVQLLAEWLVSSGDKLAMARFRESVIRRAREMAN